MLGIPWFVWLAVAGVTSAMIGIHWDISWHKSIGRDTFWTPAHLAIQLCGVIAGITCGYLILWTTFARKSARAVAARAAAVQVLGFRGPLGAFITAWGGFTMITSAPFDDWWHSAYGLDVRILSPPHAVLAIGIFGVELGTMVLVASQMNRETDPKVKARLRMMFAYVASMVLIAAMVLVLEFTGRIFLHSAIAYRIIALLAPVTLAMAPRATGMKWGSTAVAGMYTIFVLAMEWILPLFPAQPKLGPVLHAVTQFIPNGFPLLLIVPALVMDWLRPRISGWPNWRQALVMGACFLAALLVAEWPFAAFLQSEGARNWFFGSHYLEYFAGPKGYAATYRFIRYEKTTAEFVTGMAGALACGFAASWLGLVRGEWMSRVHR